MCTPCNVCLGPSLSRNQTTSRSLQPFLHSSCRVLSGMPWHVLSSNNCSFAWGDLDHHLISGSLILPEPITQMASRSVQPFFCMAHDCDRQTMLLTQSVTVVLRCSLIIMLTTTCMAPKRRSLQGCHMVSTTCNLLILLFVR